MITKLKAKYSTQNYKRLTISIRKRMIYAQNGENLEILLIVLCFYQRNVYKDKYFKRIKEKLVACLKFRAVQSIRTAATKINDFQMLGLITDDLIAKEAHYQSSCYKLYAKVNQDNVDSVTTDQSAKVICKCVELFAFKEVSRECYQLLEHPTVNY